MYFPFGCVVNDHKGNADFNQLCSTQVDADTVKAAGISDRKELIEQQKAFKEIEKEKQKALKEKEKEQQKAFKEIEKEKQKAIKEKEKEQQKALKEIEKDHKKANKLKEDSDSSNAIREFQEAGIKANAAEIAYQQRVLEQIEEEKKIAKLKEKSEQHMRVKEALNLDDSSALDESMLDIETQKKLLEEAAQQKGKNSGTNNKRMDDNNKDDEQFYDTSETFDVHNQSGSSSSPVVKPFDPMWHPPKDSPCANNAPQGVANSPLLFRHNHYEDNHAEFTNQPVVTEQPRPATKPATKPSTDHPYEPVPGLAESDHLPQIPQPTPNPPTTKGPVNDNPHNLDVGSMIQFGKPPCYGVIKWMGYLSDFNLVMAGVEVVCVYNIFICYTMNALLL